MANPSVTSSDNDNKPSGEAEAVRSNKKRKGKEFAPYGNYRNYYGYRLGHDMEEDPRFKLFDKDWFRDKDCLDVGCNVGLITINIARKFHCRSILGIDIDPMRIRDAERHLNEEVTKDRHCRKHKVLVGSENGEEDDKSVSLREDQKKDIEILGYYKKRTISDIVSFRCENFIMNKHSTSKEVYDTIICLSVTKWVHLNWGDDGLITMFVNMWTLLRPGGILVLEPQPWKSYGSNRLVTETSSYHFKNIEIYPQDFQEILLDKIGFKIVEQATSDVPSTTAGFNRPILVFRK